MHPGCPLPPPWPACRRRLAAWVIAHGSRVHPSGRLWWGGVKEFADGSLGSHTALMWEPYADVGPEHERPTGQRMIEPQRLTQLVQGALSAGLQVGMRAARRAAGGKLQCGVWVVAASATQPTHAPGACKHASRSAAVCCGGHV